MRREIVELCSTTSDKVVISRVWEVATGNAALLNWNYHNDSDYINVIIYQNKTKNQKDIN